LRDITRSNSGRARSSKATTTSRRGRFAQTHDRGPDGSGRITGRSGLMARAAKFAACWNSGVSID